MRSFALTSALACATAFPSAAASIEDGIAYVLNATGDQLIISPDLRNPTDDTRVSLNGPTAGFNLEGIAYRPSNRTFVGWDDETDTVYSVDVATGAVAPLAAAPATPSTNGGPIATSSPNLGIDFNNVLDAARVVSESDENLVYFPNDAIQDGSGFPATRGGTIDRFTDPFFAPGDVNEGESPQIVANAYSNAVPSPATTVQRVLLAGNDALAFLDNNAGTVDTIGEIVANGIQVDVNQTAGYDILSLFEGDNLPIIQIVNAALNLSELYTLDAPLADGGVTTVNANFVGAYDEIVRGLAVAPSPVPVPAAGLLLPLAFGGLAMMRRRKKV